MKHIDECPDCLKLKELVCPYDIFYIPENKQEKICQDCVDVKAEKQFEKNLENS